MRPGESFVAQPIRSLQTMLRVIAENDDRYPTVVPDGIYGLETTNAVSTFQRRAGLPITGITNQETWEAIVAAYEPALVEVDQAQSIQVILNPGQVIRRDEKHLILYLAQAMLTVLSIVYASVSLPSFNGILDLPTSESIASFQELSLLPITGELDKHTWKHLALQYTLAANIQGAGGEAFSRTVSNS